MRRKFLYGRRTLRLSDCGVDNLQYANGERRSFARAGLRLGDSVSTLADLDDGARLNSRRRFISIGIDSS